MAASQDTHQVAAESLEGNTMFSFGIITDTHIRAPEGDNSSPYSVNELANDRARYAVSLLKAQKPDFVVHLGDMVHPLPEMDSYEAACKEATNILKPLSERLHYVPGNHDVGDKPFASGPANCVTNDTLDKYHTQFGPSWKCFLYKNCCFIIINSSLVNSSLADAQCQLDWLEATFSENTGKRFIVFSHYPLFLHDIDEAEHYDNIANPGRQTLLDLFKTHKVELVFSGHVHHFFYSQESRCAYYILPPTSFTRQDYAELFAVEPAAEFGRDDTGKLSVTVVHMSTSGHELQIFPTAGATSTDSANQEVINAITRRQRSPGKLSVSLRHAWYESKYLPYNGPMEEFGRKIARNDYGLLRLLQLGIKDVRVPLQDLTGNNSRQRMRDYCALGIRFHIFYLAEQHASALIAFEKWENCVTSIECVLSGSIETWTKSQLQWPPAIPASISYASSGSHHVHSDKPFAHSVSNGFHWPERADIFSAVNAWSPPETLKGIVFQVPWEADLTSTISEMNTEFANSRWECKIYLRLANSNPAVENFDEDKIVHRVKTAMSLVESNSKLHLVLDTFMDIDRGYSPRHGLVDRLYNLRDAAALNLN